MRVEAAAWKLPAMAESAWLSRVLDTLRLHRWRHVHFEPGITARGVWRTPFSGHNGFPDICALKGGRLLVAELKVGKAFPTPEQRAWLDQFTSAGAESYVWYPDMWDEVYEVLSRPGYQ